LKRSLHDVERTAATVRMDQTSSRRAANLAFEPSHKSSGPRLITGQFARSAHVTDESKCTTPDRMHAPAHHVIACFTVTNG
jgi:hypothetical protein